jgi:hypothetical protein
MSDLKNPDENPSVEEPHVPEVYGAEEDAESVGLPDQDFLGLSPGDANEETEPGADPVPHGG